MSTYTSIHIQYEEISLRNFRRVSGVSVVVAPHTGQRLSVDRKTLFQNISALRPNTKIDTIFFRMVVYRLFVNMFQDVAVMFFKTIGALRDHPGRALILLRNGFVIVPGILRGNFDTTFHLILSPQ